MSSSSLQQQIRDHALSIWSAGVDAVTPRRLFADKTRLIHDRLLTIDDQLEIDLSRYARILVVGAGKAAASMASELYRLHLHRLQQPVLGWINAPAGTFQFGDAGPNIHLHVARGAGINEPTPEAVYGTQQILELLKQSTPQDLVLVLLSGGGSALLVAPPPGLTLTDKQSVAQVIAAAGGNIEQLNAVRRAVSAVKGGKLVGACRAARMITLIISDVLGDSLQTIASGPTVVAANCQPHDALRTLEELDVLDAPQLQNVVTYLRAADGVDQSRLPTGSGGPQVDHIILANNATAVDAAGVRAVELGYRYVMQCSRGPEGDVMQLAKQLSRAVDQLFEQQQVDCLISGGEPTVMLPAKEIRGKGGRNQQLTLAVMDEMVKRGWPDGERYQRSCIFLSGGTDGEDGPTLAAGAFFDRQILEQALRAGANVEDYLARADAYSFFQRCGGLIQTGPTNTNVCDLRLALTK